MTILVTGATSGIGLAMATLLAQRGKRVAIVGRSPASTARAAQHIQGAAGHEVSGYSADLAEADQVVALAEAVGRDCATLEALVLCAGVTNPEQRVTRGVDTTLAVNHLAPARLVAALDDRLAGGRIVLVSSSRHGAAGPFDPAAFAADSARSGTQRYEATKLLGLLYATARVNQPHRGPMEVIDPGFVRTRLGRNAPAAFRLMLTLTRPFQVAPSVPAGLIADRLAADDFHDGGYRNLTGMARLAPNAQDPLAAEQAWTWTEAQLAES